MNEQAYTPQPCYRCGSAPEIGQVEGAGTWVVACSRRNQRGEKNCSNWTGETATEAQSWEQWDIEQVQAPRRDLAISEAYDVFKETGKTPRELLNAHEELVEALKPFEKLLQDHNDKGKDDIPVFGVNSVLITLGDLRKARAILAKLEIPT